jgi:Family of unknown function (DUF6502)
MSAALATWSELPFHGLRMSENDVKKPLLAACRHLLHPLVRILLRHGISYGEFADSVRGAYIDIAQNELVPPDRPQTDARIAILTGLTRQDVFRIRSLDGEVDGVGLSRIARVLQGWSQDPQYLGPYGLPLEVPFSGGKIAFEELGRRYAGYVRLLNRTYLPAPLDPVGLERLGKVVNYFIDTVDFNLQKKKQGAGRFERYAMTVEGLSPDAFKQFDELIREKGQELLEKVDDWLGDNETKGGQSLPAAESIKTGIGIFHFIEKSPKPSDDDTEDRDN